MPTSLVSSASSRQSIAVGSESERFPSSTTSLASSRRRRGPSATAINIILADDHDVIRIGVRHLARSVASWRILGDASNSSELLRHSHLSNCDVVVTDYCMPGGEHPDGLHLISALRRRNPSIRIVVLTMLRNTRVLEAVLSAGADAVVEKTDASVELLVAIAAAARGESYVSTSARRRLVEFNQCPSTRLTTSQIEVVRMLAGGRSISQIAQQTHRSTGAISRHKTAAMIRLGVDHAADLHNHAVMMGLLPGR
ncbi:DNA-binding response regulator [Stenotrophomonas sp. HMWF022]|nr:DNA-binding response regulator [Stenotrophomonas sp. HMWF023]PTT54954.1 DNA-binding response regulator [Stenotrophomonas sp. HMWF022]